MIFIPHKDLEKPFSVPGISLSLTIVGNSGKRTEWSLIRSVILPINHDLQFSGSTRNEIRVGITGYQVTDIFESNSL